MSGVWQWIFCDVLYFDPVLLYSRTRQFESSSPVISNLRSAKGQLWIFKLGGKQATGRYESTSGTTI